MVYPPYYPPELGNLEARNASPDRSHNETFDALAMRGLIGFGVQLFLFGSFFYHILRWLGLIRTRRHRNTFLALAVVGGVVGWFLPYLVMGEFVLSGVGLPVGIAGGMILYMMGFALAHLRTEPVEHPYALLLVALLSAVMAHFVEIHFGIAIVVTRLYFWVYAALAVVVGVPLIRHQEPTAAPVARRASTRRQRRRREQAKARGDRVITPTLVVLSVMVALALSVMVVDFITPEFRVVRQTVAIPWMFAGMWIFGGLAVTSESAYEQDRQDRWATRWGVYALVTMTLGGLYLILHWSWLRSTTVSGGRMSAEELMALVDRMANLVTLFYVWAFLLIALSAAVLYVWDPAPRPRRFTAAGPFAAAYPLLGLVALAMIVQVNLNVPRADIYSKQAQAYEASGQWDVAIMLYRKALELQPEQDRYLLNLGRVYLNKVQATRDDPQQQEALLQEGLAVLERARDISPLNVDHWRNLASFHRAWASLVEDPDEQRQHLEEADRYYAKALELAPTTSPCGTIGPRSSSSSGTKRLPSSS
ncbi:MAG: tetratricopeptide repeat protein [Ardenticatenia bacterium]|nr:tetratricopeptide repeat protein [Ardenticatenia bacterium]